MVRLLADGWAEGLGALRPHDMRLGTLGSSGSSMLNMRSIARARLGTTVDDCGPYGVCNFEVELDGRSVGFAEVRGVGCELDYAAGQVHCRVKAVTMRRGLLGDRTIWSWVQRNRSDATDLRTVRVTLLDSRRSPVCSWELRRARPAAWSGPSLDAAAAGELAI